MIKELIKKIELQSILVLLLTLLAGYFLLKIDNSFNTPAGILGTISIGFGILYTFGSFFSNQIRESYKDVILEYKATISTLRSSHKDIQKSYQDTMGTQKENQVGEYSLTSDTGTQSG
jgi:hypothetical protein